MQLDMHMNMYSSNIKIIIISYSFTLLTLLNHLYNLLYEKTEKNCLKYLSPIS